ncbi:alpha/beta hydrolase family esterase [Actinomadura flavalba]|uniref:alpha/beta hydrolase family esterase n=1 Tax=Actinomadura flavalba TaxID=1120938 RepID=UPI00037DE886|nr:PHB depolymerase family esterase [Actinomadura flavalba]
MRRLLLVLFGLVLALSACTDVDEGGGGKPDEKAPAKIAGIPTAAGTHKQKIDVGTVGHREFLAHVPPQLAKGDWKNGKPEKKLPVVLALHGGLANMGKMQQISGFDKVADEEGFLVVYPDGFMTTWNAGDCCGAAKIGNIKDVDFLSKVIDKLTDSGLVDKNRVYVTGFSNGAGMAYRMACEAPEKVAAIGVVEGALVTKCDPGQPVSAMIFHGTADGNVPIGGGGRRDINDDRGYPPVKDAVDFWRRVAGLPEAKRGMDAQTKNTTCQATGKGDAGVQVTFCRIDGGRHAWPSGAAATLWGFFKTHPKRP